MASLRWGLIGGGEGSQIGPVHRMAARLDGRFTLVAGALDHRPDEARAFARRLGIAPDRAYSDWRTMVEAERHRDDRPDLVTVATPNATHFEISRALLDAGFNVFCEKPLTVTSEQARELAAIAKRRNRLCAVNFGYSGYPLVRHMRAMIQRGDLGDVRLVFAEFAHGHHATSGGDNPRIRWRYDPAQAGISAQFADCGIHAAHLACFVTADTIIRLSADFVSCVPGRPLEDDAMVNFRTAKGIAGRLWTSSIALGRQHGLALQVFGEKGGLRWRQEAPDTLYWTRLGGRTEIIQRGEADLSPEAESANRTAVGHPEGMPLAFANLYSDIAGLIDKGRDGQKVGWERGLVPLAEDGLHSVDAIEAAVESARSNGMWIDLPSR